MTTRLVVVTGTSTEVGKTIATAALAVCAPSSPLVVKPVQTGVGAGSNEPGDADVVERLAGCETVTFAELAEPLAPATAARREGLTLPTVAEHARRIVELAGEPSQILVEGAGGLLVRMDSDEGTMADLIEQLAYLVPDGIGVDVVIVAAAGLGTLNHTELTVRELRNRGIEPVGVVIGSWPEQPGLAERCNLEDLPCVTGLPILATIPDGAGSLSPERFRAEAPAWFTSP